MPDDAACLWVQVLTEPATQPSVSGCRRLLAELERLVSPPGPRRGEALGVTAWNLQQQRLTVHLAPALLEELAYDLERLEVSHSLAGVRPGRARQLLQWHARGGQGTRYRLGWSGRSHPYELHDLPGLHTGLDWVAADVYLYGTITLLGGRREARIQIRDERLGHRHIQCERADLEGSIRHRLYRQAGVHVRALYQISTGKVDHLSFVGFVETPQTVHDLWAAHVTSGWQAQPGAQRRALRAALHRWQQLRQPLPQVA